MEYKKMMSGLTKGAKELAEEIAGSNFGKTIFPGKEALINELNTTIAQDEKFVSSIIKEDVQKQIARSLNGVLGFDAEEANKIATSISPDNFSNDIDNLSGKIGEENVEKLKKVTENTINKAKQNIDTSDLSIPDKIMKYPKAYFSNPDKNIRNTRIATAAATYAGVTVGGRYLSGGTLTTDSYGRKDIAGVPFL